MSDRMLVAIRDGYVDNEGRAEEICAGKTRIAPEVLRDGPELAEFFEADFSVPASAVRRRGPHDRARRNGDRRPPLRLDARRMCPLASLRST